MKKFVGKINGIVYNDEKVFSDDVQNRLMNLKPDTILNISSYFEECSDDEVVQYNKVKVSDIYPQVTDFVIPQSVYNIDPDCKSKLIDDIKMEMYDYEEMKDKYEYEIKEYNRAIDKVNKELTHTNKILDYYNGVLSILDGKKLEELCEEACDETCEEVCETCEPSCNCRKMYDDSKVDFISEIVKGFGEYLDEIGFLTK